MRFCRYSWLAAGAVSVAYAGGASAAATFSSHASIDYVYNSNVFAQTTPSSGDSTITYIAGVALSDQWGPENLVASVEGRQLEYDHYSDLSHSEYSASIAFNWKAPSVFSGNFDVHQDHTMAPFKDTNSTQLQVNTNTTLSAGFDFKVLNDYTLGTTFNRLDSKTPQELYPDAGVIENSQGFTFRYVGIAHLSYGIQATERE